MSGEKESDPDEAQNQELACKLEEVGLNAKYWLPVLGEKIAIKNVQSFQHVQSEGYDAIKNDIRNISERRALCKLFNIPERMTQSSEALKEQYEQASAILNQLKELSSEGKTRQNEYVKQKVEEIQKVLEIPSQYSAPSDEPLENLIDHFQKHVNHVTDFYLNQQNASDIKILTTASGGLALEGIYKTNHINDAFLKHEPLLEVLPTFSLDGPYQGPVFEKKVFTSSLQENHFRKSVGKLGYFFSNSTDFSHMGFGEDAGSGSSVTSEYENVAVSSGEETYACITRYHYIPLESCYFTKDKLNLSQKALDELKDIERIINGSEEQRVTHRCETFFKTFGSHANMGPIHFGGIFSWKATMTGFQEDQLQEAKSRTSEFLSSYVGATYYGSGGNTDVSAATSQSSMESDTQGIFNKNIEFSVTKTGGQTESDCPLQWKASLIANNKTWSVIDRGLQLIPVWEIIRINHKKDFTNVGKLGDCLAKSYEFLIGQTEKPLFVKPAHMALEEAKYLLHEIKTWTNDDVEANLRRLLDQKQILTDIFWACECLSDKGLQDFFLQTIEKYKDTAVPENVKLLTRQLLEPHVDAIKNFPKASLIMERIKETESDGSENISVVPFDEFMDILNNVKEEIKQVTALKSTPEENRQEKERVASNVTRALCSLLQSESSKQNIDCEVLLLCILNNYGFCAQNDVFQKPLSWEDVEFIDKKISEFQDLKEKGLPQAQAFVLLTGLSDGRDITPEFKQERLNFMIQLLAGSLSAEVRNILKQTGEVNWKIMEENLKSFIFDSTRRISGDIRIQTIFKDLESVFKKREIPIEVNLESVENKINDNFLKLIKRLGLEEYYPQKMKKGHFHVIHKRSQSENQDVTESQLPFLFLEKLLTLDYRARYLKGENNSKSNGKPRPVPLCVSFDPESLFGDSEEEEESSPSSVSGVHPMDIQMAIFHCADDNARQYIYTKLSFCQFAVPLLVPNPNTKRIEFPLWAFQEIKKKWKSKTKEPNKTNEKHIAEAETPFVTFIRFGSSSFSKSQILNSLMGNPKNHIFFHRHCKGSTRDSLLMNGVVEIAWYCPSGKDSDLFDDCIAFTNLRGDAREHEQQVKFLLDVSSGFVILLTDADTENTQCKQLLKDISRSTKPTLFLLPDKERTQRKSGIMKIGLKNRNEAELIQEITSEINAVFAASSLVCSLDTCATIARNSGFIVDEDKPQCKKSKENAQPLVDLLTNKALLKMKTDFLPLQGPLWHEWCQKDQKFTRLKEKSSLSIEQQKSNIKCEKEAIRQEQLKKAFPLNAFMRSYLEALCSKSQMSSMYFLQWLKVHLDKLSSEHLSMLHQKYHELWSQKQKEKRTGENKQTPENDLESLSAQINDSSFGLEHVLREVGQIYEALEILHIKKDCVSMLPDIAAKLMISGYPVELMDGDAAHVPLTWITAVLDKVTEMIGDKKIFVLSVLGIQSTGKSTLLNAMFGLQFAVSAGRCTRGAFMQLIEVEETLRREMRFDYLLVIDTEGLRAIELSNITTRNHDNELATFVIGLGNITLINIFGENPSEMQDILQIAVQAFLRMKRVRIRPSCLFVHQNVGEITAREKNLEGRRRFQENLDEMTMIAAEQEHCEVTHFNDVIIFDVNTHIHYFTQLWEGDPPMAPPNPGYSQNVQDLKQIILDIGRNESPSNILTISQFKARVMDLWNALLNENFVFSFRNSLEIAAYNKLETAYGQWTWDLRKPMLSIENEISNLIQNDKMQRIDKSDINKQIQETFDAVMEKLKEFFSNDKDQDLLIQWEESTKNRVTNVKRELVEEAKKKADELITSKNNGKKMTEWKEKWEDELFKSSQELALTLKGRELNEEILEENFIKIWNPWILQVQNEMPPTETPPIRKDLENILRERFNKHPEIQKLITESSTWRDVNEEFSRYISMKTKWLGLRNEKLSKAETQQVKETTQAVEMSVNKYLQRKEEQKMDYQSSYFHEMLHQIEMEVENKLKKSRFKADYVLFVTLYLLQKSGLSFIQMSDAFRKSNDPLRHLESKRSQFFQSFRMFCDGSHRIASLADFLRDRLQESLREAVYKKAAIDTANEMKCNVTAFNGNRSKLEFHLMKSLAEKEEFQWFSVYINEPKTSFEIFIKECVDQYYREKASSVSFILKSNLKEFQNHIQRAIENTSNKTKDRRGDVSSWLDTFCSELSAHLTLSHSDFKGVKNQNIKNIDLLEEEMTKALEKVVENLRKEFSLCDVSNIKARPYEILYEQLAGCWETCPLCNAVCTNTVPGHKEDHSVKFHRPKGIKGIHWHQTDHLVTDICSSVISSDRLLVLSEDNKILYREYRRAGPRYSKWSITPDHSSLNYWKWVVCRFQSDFEEYNNKKFEGKGEIPSQWREITKKDAISELNRYIDTA
uniref:VLIG-type G domain-containing protein n=1 Tax=Leptobrachium leishanense TaxID=445787 RepID=A0A8C5MTW0_9ANUR